MKRCLVGFVILLFAGALYAASVTIGIKGASNKFSSTLPMGLGAYGIISSDLPKVTFSFKKAAGETDRVYVVMEILNDGNNQTKCYSLKKSSDSSSLFYSITSTDLGNCTNPTLDSTKAFSVLSSGGTYTYTLELNATGFNSPVNIYSIMVDDTSPSIIKRIDFKTYLVNPEGAPYAMFGVNSTSARYNLQY